MKRTVDDFILHFVQFTENLFQDFLVEETKEALFKIIAQAFLDSFFLCTGGDRKTVSAFCHQIS